MCVCVSVCVCLWGNQRKEFGLVLQNEKGVLKGDEAREERKKKKGTTIKRLIKKLRECF